MVDNKTTKQFRARGNEQGPDCVSQDVNRDGEGGDNTFGNTEL